MKTNRRDFIRNSALLTAGALVLPSLKASPGMYSATAMKPGLQVYSVRKQLLEDFEGTMKYISEVGYTYLEGYGLGTDGLFLGKYTAKEYNKVITDLGMELKSTHCSYAKAEDAGAMIDAAASTGAEYLIVPSTPGNLRKTLDDWKAVAENYNKLGELCKKAGMRFGYHNHTFEFKAIDGILPMEFLIASTEKDLVFFEADLFWVTRAGYDPLRLLKQFPGRIFLFHVKDANADLEPATVGKGIIDFKSIFEIARADSLHYYFVEDERLDNPFKNIKDDYNYVLAQPYMN